MTRQSRGASIPLLRTRIRRTLRRTPLHTWRLWVPNMRHRRLELIGYRTSGFFRCPLRLSFLPIDFLYAPVREVVAFVTVSIVHN
jgi:hypothetical protein